MSADPYYLPLSALQHYLYCPRQCALIHVEQAWADNFFTAEGNALHEKADSGHDQTLSGKRILRALPVLSHQHLLTGKCDVVEILSDNQWRPVEYKRGKPKSNRIDEVQLCGQVLCLEEMTGQSISSGLLFYGETRRRVEVDMDSQLRGLTLDTAIRTRAMILSQQTPSAEYEEKRCQACSLLEICVPKKKKQSRSVASWLEKQISA